MSLLHLPQLAVVLLLATQLPTAMVLLRAAQVATTMSTRGRRLSPGS